MTVNTRAMPDETPEAELPPTEERRKRPQPKPIPRPFPGATMQPPPETT